MKDKRGFSIAGIVIGGLLLLSPFIGLLGSVLGMTRAFKVLEGPGVGDPKALSDSISVTLYSTVASLVLLVVGIVVLTFSLISFFHPRASSLPPLPQQPSQ